MERINYPRKHMPITDEPKSLGSTIEQAKRFALLNDAHIHPLTEFVDQIRQETGYGSKIPYFDPLDGGVNAKCLFLLEAAGPKAVISGFISRNNPDDSARNFWELNREAGVPRHLTVSWNIVPWYIGTGKKIRAAERADINEGLIYLERLLPLLQNLSVVIFTGRKAEKAERLIREQLPQVEVVKMLHPSPLVVNTKKENRGKILERLQYVHKLLREN
jgi:uracil-DNA glycosylase